ncbi:MAG: K+-transporting ATPase, A chain [Rhodobacteraceae bacterium]|nr:K+-transporting ATPase, A chain [Paracoccaceae bacterium]
MSPLRLIYLGLAIWGAVHPMYWIVQWFQVEGWDLQGLIAAWLATSAATALAWDLVISAVALTVFVLAEVAVRRNWVALLAIPATFCIGVSCGLPLYLFLRSAPVR